MPWVARRPRPVHKVRAPAAAPLLQVADTHVPAVARTVGAALRAVSDALSLAEVSAAILARNVEGAIRLTEQAWHEAAQTTLTPSLHARLGDVALAAAAITEIPSVRLVLKKPADALLPVFTQAAPEVLAAVDTEIGLRITAISDATRQAVRGIIHRSLESGQSVPAMAREIRTVVGLTARQAASVARYRAGLQAARVKPERLITLVEKRTAALRHQRALTIARTETVLAANAGQYAIWQAAAQQGVLVPGAMRRFWLVAVDERLCVICRGIAARHERGIQLQEVFQTPVGPLRYPPAHPRCRCTVILKPLPGNLRTFLQPPPLEIPPLPVLDEAKATKTFLEDLGGTTGAKKYRGSDRVVRVVKRPRDPVQAYVEAVTNRLYTLLGADAPESSLLVRDGELVGLGNKFVGGVKTLKEAGLTTARAKRVLEHFVADVWLANRDAVGLDLDNILVKGPRLIRADNGAALTFRAQGSRKPLNQLDKLIEWDGFFDAGINPAYAQVAQTAGIRSPLELGQQALDQIQQIVSLGRRTNGFADLLPEVPGVSASEREALRDLLRLRARTLDDEIRPRLEAYLQEPAHERSLRALMGDTEYNRMVQNAQRALGTAERHGLSDAELAAVHAYTTEDPQWSYHATNGALRDPRKKAERDRLQPLMQTTVAGMAKLPGYEGTVYRGTRQLPAAFLRQHEVGALVKYAGFTSTSIAEHSAFGGRYRFIIQAAGGAKDVSTLSAFKREAERLFPPDTVFRVIDIEQSGNQTMYHLREVPMAPGTIQKAYELSPEDAAALQATKAAAAQLLAHEAALTLEELAAVQAEWARFHDKVASGAIAVPVDEMSSYEAARLAWLQAQETR